MHVKGTRKRGRIQELALATAQGIAGLHDTAVFSVGSDGTDGPTDDAGLCGWYNLNVLQEAVLSICDEPNNNNAYVALEVCGGLIKTGATGTNANDLTVLLLKMTKVINIRGHLIPSIFLLLPKPVV